MTNTELITTDQPQTTELLDVGTYDQMWRVAKGMALSRLMPKHLKGNDLDESTANFMMVVEQAQRWGISPYAMAPKTYVVSDKLGFEGQLIAAIVNSHAGLIGRLEYEHSGKGDNRTVKVTGTFSDTGKTVSIELVYKDAPKPTRKNSTALACQLWITNPDQKLCYSGAIMWARRHCPEVLLGIHSIDELEMIADSTPAAPSTTVVTLDDLGKEPATTEPGDVEELLGEMATCANDGQVEAVENYWLEKHPELSAQIEGSAQVRREEIRLQN